MKTLTLRIDEQEAEKIEWIKKRLGIVTASNAIMTALDLYCQMSRHGDDLREIISEANTIVKKFS